MRFEQQTTSTEKYTQFEDKPGFDEVNEIAGRSRYASSLPADCTGLTWCLSEVSEFRLSTDVASVETLLPIGDLASDADASAAGGSSVDYEFLPSAQEILDEIVPAAFKARVFKCFLDAAVGEQIARMVAMKSATENADEMIRDISQEYNRARQTQITSELAEIIGGAAALE